MKNLNLKKFFGIGFISLITVFASTLNVYACLPGRPTPWIAIISFFVLPLAVAVLLVLKLLLWIVSFKYKKNISVIDNLAVWQSVLTALIIVLLIIFVLSLAVLALTP